MRHALDVARMVIRLSFAREPLKAAFVTAIFVGTAAAAPLSGLLVRAAVDDALAHRATAAAVAGAAAGAMLIGAISLTHLATVPLLEIADLNDLEIDRELVALGSGAPGLQHLERPDYADKLDAFRRSSSDAYWAFRTVLTTAGLTVQIALTTGILGAVRPLLLLLPLAALPALVAGKWAHERIQRAYEREAGVFRLNRHLLQLLTEVPPAKEIRIFGLGDELRRRQRETWDYLTQRITWAWLVAAAGRAVAQLVIAGAFLGSVTLLVVGSVEGKLSVGNALLGVVVAGQLNRQSTQALGISTTLHGLSTLVRRLRWLQAAAAEGAPMSGKRPPPGDLRTGIVLEDVTFCYPGAERPALQNVSLELPAGSVVALVGENGAGKSSVAKLLCRLYDPQAGRILIDDVELRQLDVDRWRERITGAFQDFASYQARIGESVGLGKLDRIHDAPAIEDALGRAGGLEFALALPEKLDTQLGTAYAPGVDLSGGQWQKVALARGSMPRRPLLVLLDEPTSALDAAAEHALYERYAESARHARQAHGAVTVIISHRFSTVRMADVIVVLSKGRVLEVGSHDDLQAAGGLYAELFALQKRAYGRA